MNDPIYFDTSALAKLVLRENESDALERFLDVSSAQPATSEISHIELVRAVMRHDPAKLNIALDVLAEMVMLPLTAAMKEVAGRLKPASLRSLDAIHLATALEIQADLHSMVSYDNRLVEASRAAGIETVSPGA